MASPYDSGKDSHFFRDLLLAVMVLILYGIAMQLRATAHAVIAMCDQTGAANCHIVEDGG